MKNGSLHIRKDSEKETGNTRLPSLLGEGSETEEGTGQWGWRETEPDGLPELKRWR